MSGSALPSRSSWTRCAGWSTAATTRRESPCSTATANSPCGVAPAGWPTSRRRWPRCAPASLAGTTGLGHTRWATHGRPTDRNAHPHRDAAGKIAVVHNGIIENFATLRHELEAAGVEFASDTDTEVAVHLVAQAYRHGDDGR